LTDVEKLFAPGRYFFEQLDCSGEPPKLGLRLAHSELLFAQRSDRVRADDRVWKSKLHIVLGLIP
jgi:hypothetical protein